MKVFYYFGPLQCDENVLKFPIQIHVMDQSIYYFQILHFDISKQTLNRRV